MIDRGKGKWGIGGGGQGGGKGNRKRLSEVMAARCSWQMFYRLVYLKIVQFCEPELLQQIQLRKEILKESILGIFMHQDYKTGHCCHKMCAL